MIDPFGQNHVRSDRFFRWLNVASWLVACLPIVFYFYGFFVWAWTYMWLGHRPYADADLPSVPLLDIMIFLHWCAFIGVGPLLPALIVQYALSAATLYSRDGGWTLCSAMPVLRVGITVLVYAGVVGLLRLDLFDMGFFID